MIQPIVLAAGLGTRLGAIKALLPIGRRPALAIVLNTIRSAGLPDALVVLGHDGDAILARVAVPGDRVVLNPHPEHGLSGSLRLALDRVQEEITGVLIFLVDMPYIAPSTVLRVMDAVQAGATLAAPVYRGRRGFPVYLQRTHFSPLRDSLHGDRGAGDYLRAHHDAMALPNVDDPGCVHDIDCAADLRYAEGGTPCDISD